MPDRWKIILALVIIAGFTAWLLNYLIDDEVSLSDLPRHDPDYYMNNFSALNMEENGKAKNRLFAEYMAHYPDDDTIELINPRLEIFRENKLPVHVVAEKGWVTTDNEVILLSGNVKLWQDNIEGERELEVTSSDVKILTEQQYAETEKYTTFTSPKLSANAVGVRAYFHENKLELLNNVQSTIKQKQLD